MKMNALIKSNLGENTNGMTEEQFAEAYCQAVWIEEFRLRNQAEMLAAMFGGKRH